MGAILPEDLGGAGLGYIEYCIIIEELSRVDGSIGIILAAHTSLCANHIYKFGTDSQRELYIPRLASGEWLGCWGLTEPSAGSDASGTLTRAAFDGQWILDGSKTMDTRRFQNLYNERTLCGCLRRHGCHRCRGRKPGYFRIHRGQRNS